ncbi:uncharacterized protein LOC141877315 isoform X1 [Acropora palmata]|uniref:uncharacterized protein LOC141877315 isoform X1 n=1 Tax=Acropora palmata TaxID=6131 RepID=UPI003DA0FF6C
MTTVVESSTSFTISTVPGGEALGVENGSIPDENITASSSAGPAPAHLARLNGPFAWCVGKAEDCYLQIDLGSLHLVCAVATQGNPGGNRDYVRRYKLQCSADGVNWTLYEENGNTIIAGNTDNWSVKRKDLDQEIVTRLVRFCPVDWYCWPCMRVELYGAPLNINEKIAELQSQEGGGGFVLDRVLVTTQETDGHSSQGEEAISLKKNETMPSETISEDAKDYEYQVHIYTGYEWGAGTDANILITLFGEDGDSEETKLDNNKNNFERGQKDSFAISCGKYLGRVNKIRIGHDNTGFGAAWFLDKVTVEDPKTGEEVIFSCQRWFSTSDDDGKISRELVRDDKEDATIIVSKDKVLETAIEDNENVDPGQNVGTLKENGTTSGEVVQEEVKDYLYQVHIYTGDKWGAGTDANVLITIFGEDGDSGEKKLDNNKNNFESGQKDSFVISCGKYLGRVSKIRIGHDNSGFGAAWFLDKVTIEDPKTGKITFSCQRWFSSSDGDGKISRELVRDDKDEEMIIVSQKNVLETAIAVSENADPGQNVETLKENATTSGEVVQEEVKDYLYQVHIYTGEKWGAGTDANVLITIFGENGDSGEKNLDNNRNNFESGQKDSFSVSCGTYLGRLSKIRIGHDNTGFGAAWFLDKVTVEDSKTGEEVTFSCQRWFSTSDGDGKISRELVRDDEDEETTIVSQDYEYQVHIYTGYEWGAGTDANILITLFGEDGDSEETKLDNNKNNFERGQKDYFVISCGKYLGRLSKIRIGHDNTGLGAAWFLDKVTVEDPKTGEEVIFSCQRWFSTSDDDGKISRELVRYDKEDATIIVSKDKVLETAIHDNENVDPGQNVGTLMENGTTSGEVVQEEVKDYLYQVHIYTGDKWGAGTDANVLITIFGENGNSGEKKLDNNRNNFEGGQKDSFSVSCGTYLGRLSKIRIGHDNTGFGAAWFLNKVTVEDPKTGDVVIFPCQRWFSTNDGDGKISRELVRDDKVEVEINVSQDLGTDGQSAEVRTTEDFKYSVDIYTGDKWFAGTDANVLITIFGEKGDSGEKKLDKSRNNFERGQKDSFRISSGDLGRLTKIWIGHDNTGVAAAWFLDKVTVEDLQSGEIGTFSCQRWLSTSDGDGLITRELVRDHENTREKLGNDGEPDRDKNSLKEKENGIIKDTKEERKQKQEHDEIESIIEKQEVKRKEADRDEGVMDEEQSKAQASIQLVLEEEKKIERREKPDGQADETIKYSEVVVEKNINPATKEYSRIEEEHRKRMQEIEALLGEHEERRKKEKDEKAKLENDATRRKEEDRRRRDEEARKKREEERLKWEEEHKKWEEERKKRDLELQAVLEEGRRKREEDRRKREDDLKNIREQERKKREEERKKRMEEETKKLAELRREREERWRKRSDVAVVDVNLTLLQAKKEDEDVKNRFEDKKKKEEGWKMAVDAPRKVEEDMKKFRDEERKRLEEERRKQKEKELADAEAEKAIKSELRAKRLEKGEPRSHVSIATIQLGAPRDVAIAEEKRRIELRVQQIEEERKVREEGEKRQREDADRKKKEEEEKLKEEQERMQKEQEAERAKRKEELRLKREAEERKKQEEEQRQREQERKRRRASLEEKTKRLEEDRKKREEEELIWRREMEERKKQEDEEKKKQMEIKRIKRLSIDRKKFDEDEKKRLDAIERKRIEEEERARLEDEQRRREDRERWKMKQMERRRSGEIYRRKSEEDLRNREDRASFKERQRRKRDNKSFEKKWVFMNGESNEVPAKESMSSAVSEPVIFPPHTPETKHVSVTRPQPKTAEPKIPEPKILEPKIPEPKIPQPKKPEPEKAEPEKREPEKPVDKDEEDSRRDSLTVRVNTTITAPTRSRHSSSSHSLPRSTSSQWSLSVNGDARPYRAQPRCDHLLPTGPAVQMAEAESFFDKYDEEEEGKLRPFPSWYGSRDMGSLSHLYSPANPITDSDIDELLAIESEDFQSWKRVKKSRELEIYSRKGRGRGKPPVTKATIVLKDVPYREVIDLVTDWGERSKWDKTFDAISFLDQMADFKVLKCSLEKKNRCFVIASLDREDEQPYYAWVWKAANHPSVPGEDSKVTVLKMDTGICGAIIRPYHDATRSSKITIITQVRGSVPSPLKSTYLTGNPSKWLGWLKKHYESQEKNDAKKNENRDSSSSSSSSDN